MADAVEIIIATDYGELSSEAQEVQVVVEYHGGALDIDSPYGDFVSYSTSVTPYSWGEKWTYTFLISQNTSTSTKYGSITFSANGSEASWDYEQAPGTAPVQPPVVTILNNFQVLPYTQNEFNILVGYKNVTSSAGTNSRFTSPLTLVSSSFSNETGSYRVKVSANTGTSVRPVSASFTGSNSAGSNNALFQGNQSGRPEISVSPSTATVGAAYVEDYDITVTYYNLSSTTQIRQPSCDSGIDVNIKSTTTSGNNIIRVYTVSVYDNESSSQVTKTITFENSYGFTGTHTVTQAARKRAVPSTSSLQYWITSSYQDITVTFQGVSSVYQTAYSTLHDWVSVSRRSYTTSGGNIVATYRITTTQNTEWARTTAVFFHGTAGSGVETGSVSVGQTAGYRVEISSSANPRSLEATQSYSEALKALYYYTTNPDNDILAPVSDVNWITFTTGSRSSMGAGYQQTINANVAINNSRTPRTGHITARMRDGYPATATWTVNQNGFKEVTADTRSLDFDKGSGYQDITVTYWNIPEGDIQTPTSSENWCTITQRSSTTSGNNIVRVYRISVTANSGVARGATVSFTATNAAGEYISVSQAKNSWVEIDAITTNPLNLDYNDTDWHQGRVILLNEPNADGLTYSSSSNWISVSPGSGFKSGDNYYKTESVKVTENTTHSDRSGSVTFYLSSSQATWNIYQKGVAEAVPASTTGTVNYPQGSTTLQVTYYNARTIDNCRVTNNFSSWLTCTRSNYQTSGTDIIVTYTISYTENTGWERTGHLDFYVLGYETNYGRYTLTQGAHVYARLLSSNPTDVPDSSITPTAVVEYVHTTAASIQTPTKPSWVRSIYQSGSDVSTSDGVKRGWYAEVQQNNDYTPRTGSITFGVSGGDSCTWTIQQAGHSGVSCSTHQVNFEYQSDYYDITVTYFNIPASAITAPTSDKSWCTITQRSSSTSTYSITRVYRISVSNNSGPARGATLSFGATGYMGDAVGVWQNKHSWVEIDDGSTTNPLNLSYSDSDWHSGRVVLVNENNPNGLTYNSSSNWITVSAGSGFASGDNYYKNFSVKASNNYSYNSRTAFVNFFLSGSSATWTINQDGYKEAVPNSSSVTWDYQEHTGTLVVTYYNAGTVGNCMIGSNQSWLTYSRTGYTTSGNNLIVTYSIHVSENDDWARTGRLTVYVLGAEENANWVNVTQGTHKYTQLDSSVNNPHYAPDNTTTPTALVHYKHTSASADILTPVSSSDWLDVYASGSPSTVSQGIDQGWFVRIHQNNSPSARSGSVTFGIQGGDSCTWNIIQGGSIRIEAETHQVNFGAGVSSSNLVVTYYGIDAQYIAAPSSTGNWCTLTEVSRTTGTNSIIITYRINVTANGGEARGSVVGFTAPGSGAPGDYVTVAQEGVKWVELDASTPSSITVPFVDSGSEQTIYQTSVWYRNVRTGSSDILAPRSNYDWLVLVSSSCLYVSGVGSRYDYFWYPVDNLEGPCARTDWWFFGLTGGNPDEVYQRVNQEGPKYVDLDTGSISKDWHATSFNVQARYWNVTNNDIQAPVGAGDWVTVTELSRSSASCYIEVNYRVDLSQNDDWDRSTRRTFYAIGSYDKPFLNISQTGRIYVTLTSASNPSYVSNTPGLNGELPVWGRLNYFHTYDQSKIWTPVSDSNWARIDQTSSIKTSSQGMYQDVGLYVANNFTTESREAKFTFGIQGGEPDNVVWRVIQEPNEGIVANPRQVDIVWSGGTGTTEVSYINIGSQYISLPEVSGSVSWITGISEVSRTTVGNTIKITYAITASQNLGWARGAVVKFGCTKPGVPSEYITVAQAQKTWVEIDDDDQYKETRVPARDPSDVGTWYYSTLTYYNVPSGSELILPPVASSDDVVIEYSGSISSSLGAKYVYRVRALDNPSSGSRITSIYFNLTNGDPYQAVWNIIQGGQRSIEVSPLTASLHWSGSSYQVEVNYKSCPEDSIYSPVISGSWITASLRSREPLIGELGYQEIWNINIPENKDWERTGSIRFNAVPETLADPPVLGWHYIYQDTHKWVQVIDPVPPTASVIGYGGEVTASAHYWHTRVITDIGTPQTASTCPTGMVANISRSGLVFGDQGWTGSYVINILQNSSPEPRTGSIEFYQKDGEPATASIQIEQAPGLEVKVYPETMSVPVNRIIYDTGSSDYPLTVYWKGANSSTVLLSGSTTGSYQTGSGQYITGSFSGSWINVTEQSRSVYTSESGSTIVTYYKLDIDRNKTYERTMSVVFRAEDQEAVTVIVQAMDKRTVIDTPPITASASGGYLDLTVYYYCVSQSEMKTPVMTGPGTINLGHVYTLENGLQADYQIHLGNNPDYYARGGYATFGIVGEEGDQSLPYMQEGKKGVEADPTVVVLPSRESLAVVGATYYNHKNESIYTPVVSSPRIEIQNVTSFNTDEDDIVSLYNVHLGKNPSENRFEGTLTYSSSVGSKVLTVIQGGKPYITCNPESVRISSYPETGSIVTASYYNFLPSELESPVVSDSNVSMRLIRTESSAGSLDEEINVKQFWNVTVAPNTSSVQVNHWIDFNAGDETCRFNILQNPREGIVLIPSASIVGRRYGITSFVAEFFGIGSFQEVDMYKTGSWFLVEPRQQTVTSEGIEQVYEINYTENTGDSSRSGSVGFKLRNSGVTGSFIIIQEGPKEVEVDPSEVAIGQSGAAFTVQVTYRNTTEISDIPDPVAPSSLSITRGSYMVSSGNLIVTYTVIADTNFNSSTRRLVATFSKGSFTGTLTVIQAGTQGGKVEILSGNPLNVVYSANTQTILVKYNTTNTSNIGTPTFSSGTTLSNTEIVENTGTSVTVRYTISISANNTGNRRIMTGIFSLLEGGSTYNASLVISQAASQNISLRYSTSPIWIENILRVANTPSVNLQINVDGVGQVFNKTVYRAPDASDVEVDINRILEPYLEASELSVEGVSRKALSGTILTSTDTATWTVINDWSYVVRDSYGVLSDPPFNTVALGQYLPMTLFVSGSETNSLIIKNPTNVTSTVTLTGKDNIKDVMIPINMCGTWTIGGKEYKTINSPYVLYYYNKFGGWDSIPVTGIVLPGHEYERNTVGKKRMFTTDYNVIGDKTYELHTGFFTDEQSLKVDDIVGSVKLYLQDTNTTELIPVRMIDESVEVKTFKNQERNFPTYTFRVQEVETKKRR